MKLALWCLVTLGVLVLYVKCGSHPCQPCDEKCGTCGLEYLYCRCGTYKDSCHCCTLCYKCPGEKCKPRDGIYCGNGSVCKHADGKETAKEGTCEGGTKPSLVSAYEPYFRPY